MILTLANLLSNASGLLSSDCTGTEGKCWVYPVWVVCTYRRSFGERIRCVQEMVGVMPTWMLWMFILLYYLARVTEVGDKELQRLKHHTSSDELHSYATELIEKDVIIVSVAKQRLSVRILNGLVMGVVFAMIFVWVQGQEWFL